MPGAHDAYPPDILREQGRCHKNDGVPVEIKTRYFYPGDGEGFQEAIKKYCLHCPVWKECAIWAIENQEYGLWGGLTEEDRKMFRRHSPGGLKPPEPWPAHLNHGHKKMSFRAHLMLGELPCDECFQSWLGNYPNFKLNLKPKVSALNGSAPQNEWSC